LHLLIVIDLKCGSLEDVQVEDKLFHLIDICNVYALVCEAVFSGFEVKKLAFLLSDLQFTHCSLYLPASISLIKNESSQTFVAFRTMLLFFYEYSQGLLYRRLTFIECVLDGFVVPLKIFEVSERVDSSLIKSCSTSTQFMTTVVFSTLRACAQDVVAKPLAPKEGFINDPPPELAKLIEVKVHPIIQFACGGTLIHFLEAFRTHETMLLFCHLPKTDEDTIRANGYVLEIANFDECYVDEFRSYLDFKDTGFKKKGQLLIQYSKVERLNPLQILGSVVRDAWNKYNIISKFKTRDEEREVVE